MPGPDRQSLSAGILVGGASRRLGRDKAVVEVGGRAIAERVFDVLFNLTPRVFVVGKRDSRNPLPALPFVSEDRPVRCALAGVEAALKAAAPGPVLIVGCDHPFLSADMLMLLTDRRPGGVRCLEGPDGPEPLLAVWDPERALPVVEARLSGREYSIRGAMEAVGLEVVERGLVLEADPQDLSFLNVNTPEDLLRARSALKNY